MPIKRITSRDNPLYRECLALIDDRRARRSAGKTILDGEHLLEEAARAQAAFRYILVDEDGPGLARWSARFPSVPIIVLAPALLHRLSPVTTPTGLLAVIDIPLPAQEQVPTFAVLLEDIQDPGNLGALLRTAAAAGVDTAYLSPGCADAWSPKALRGGQGGQFRLNIHERVDLVAVARAASSPVYSAVLRAPESLYELGLDGPAAFAFGNEGNGLSADLSAVTRPFSIPMSGNVESLNVAAAAAVCLFERLRQTRSVA